MSRESAHHVRQTWYLTQLLIEKHNCPYIDASSLVAQTNKLIGFANRALTLVEQGAFLTQILINVLVHVQRNIIIIISK